MEAGIAGLDFLGAAGGGGGDDGGGGGGSDCSLSTLSKSEVLEQDYIGLSSEGSSSSPALNTELNLGLSLGGGGGGGGKAKTAAVTSTWGEYCRILTAQDFVSVGSASSCSSSGKADVESPLMAKTGTKRNAESIAQEGGSANGAVSNQVVGWPPLRSSRINIMVNHSKNPSIEDDKMVVDNSVNEDGARKKTDDRSINGSVAKKCHIGHSLFVKVNMDGVAIGRKVDLGALDCYETLAKTLEDMFFYQPTSTNATTNFIGLNEEQENGVEAKNVPKLLGGSSEFSLTYEDKDGDWMLVGDVPWRMFLHTANRLRIMRTSEAKGLAPGLHSSDNRQRKKPI